MLGNNRDYKTSGRRAQQYLAAHKEIMEKLMVDKGLSRDVASAEAYNRLTPAEVKRRAATKYIVITRDLDGGDRHYPLFDFSGGFRLSGWTTMRAGARRFTREEAVYVARRFQIYLASYNAKEAVEVVPASGGAAIALSGKKEKEVTE